MLVDVREKKCFTYCINMLVIVFERQHIISEEADGLLTNQRCWCIYANVNTSNLQEKIQKRLICGSSYLIKV